MIALPSLSQNTYKINDSIYVCYTLKENREIAILINDKILSESLIDMQNREIGFLHNIINTYIEDSVNTAYVVKDLTSKLNVCSNSLDACNRDAADKDLRIKRKNNWITGLASSTGGLLVILILLLAL